MEEERPSGVRDKPWVFADGHFHLFKPNDIPLTSLLKYAENELPLAGLLLLLASNPLGFSKNVRRMLTDASGEFDKTRNQTLSTLVDEVGEAIPLLCDKQNYFMYFSPLHIDFGLGHDDARYLETIAIIDEFYRHYHTAPNIKIAPFIGIDPRRTKQFVMSIIKNVNTKPSQNNQYEGFCGVKLYPSLGFSPIDVRTFLAMFIERNIPVTVHSQSKSLYYNREHLVYNKLSFWEGLLGQNEYSSLRINFAHFGGTAEIETTVGLNDTYFEDAGIYYVNGFSFSKSTTTYKIIKLLKRYPNTYADISAVNSSYLSRVGRIKLILLYDIIGEFDGLGDYKLADKIFWGSDYPMDSLNVKQTYSDIISKGLRHFVGDAAMAIDNKANHERISEAEKKYISKEIIEKIFGLNYLRFIGVKS